MRLASGIGVLLWLLISGCGAALAADGDGGRSQTSQNEGWRYADGPQAGAEAPEFDDAAWTGIRLPHTWNADDAFDKRKPYRRGEGWTRRPSKRLHS